MSNESILGEQTATPPGPNYEAVLYGGEQILIHLGSRVVGPEEVAEKFGLLGSGVASITLGDKEFIIVDTREDKNVGRDYVITEAEVTRRDKARGYKAIEFDEPVVLGRAHHTDQFEYPATVSRSQVQVTYGTRGLLVEDLYPSNEGSTTIRGAFERITPEIKYEVGESRTVHAADRMVRKAALEQSDKNAPHGYYMKRPVLGRHSTQIDGGVSLGGTSREAIIADGGSEILQAAYKNFVQEMDLAVENVHTFTTRSILVGVKDYVRRAMPYDAKKVDNLSKDYADDQPIALSEYLKAEAGVCRHQAMLAGLLVERLVKDGFLVGTVGLGRNQVKTLGGSHAWAIFRGKGVGEEQILDVAQNYVGTKKKARQQNRWYYELSDGEAPKPATPESRLSLGALRQYLAKFRSKISQN